MALPHRSTSIKVALPVLVMMALATLPTICTAKEDVELAQAGGRFLSTDHGAHSRKLLNEDLCGSGSAPDYNCNNVLPNAMNATCCPDGGGRVCYDVGAFLLTRCGSCNTVCPFGQVCCSGVCTDLLTDRNNCLVCGKKCSGNLPCQNGLCGYGFPGNRK